MAPTQSPRQKSLPEALLWAKTPSRGTFGQLKGIFNIDFGSNFAQDGSVTSATQPPWDTKLTTLVIQSRKPHQNGAQGIEKYDILDILAVETASKIIKQGPESIRGISAICGAMDGYLQYAVYFVTHTTSTCGIFKWLQRNQHWCKKASPNGRSCP